MGPKRLGSTLLSRKTIPDGSQGQTGGNPAVYPHQPGRPNPPSSQDSGPIGPPSRAPSTGPPIGASPMAPPGDPSDQDPNNGDTGATNSGTTSGQCSGHKLSATPIGEPSKGPSTRPPGPSQPYGDIPHSNGKLSPNTSPSTGPPRSPEACQTGSL